MTTELTRQTRSTGHNSTLPKVAHSIYDKINPDPYANLIFIDLKDEVKFTTFVKGYSHQFEF